eukprot:5205732-Amphidinium_carterae.1
MSRAQPRKRARDTLTRFVECRYRGYALVHSCPESNHAGSLGTLQVLAGRDRLKPNGKVLWIAAWMLKDNSEKLHCLHLVFMP